MLSQILSECETIEHISAANPFDCVLYPLRLPAGAMGVVGAFDKPFCSAGSN